MLKSKDTYPSPVIAAVQAAPVYFDRGACIAKVRRLTEEAASNGAELVVFSEGFVPGFPSSVHIHAPIDQLDLFTKLVESAVEIPGAAFYELQQIARDNNVFLSVGVTEKAPEKSIGLCWNTNLIFDKEGNMISRHRKLMPTWSEKLVWSFGDGSTLNVHDTEIGKIGMLICGENTNPLAKYALASQGEQIHISTYPACFPTSRKPSGEQPYFETLYVRACASSYEGKCFTVVSSQALDEAGIQILSKGDPELIDLFKKITYGGSFIIDPSGNYASDVIRDNKEGIAYAKCDISKEIAAKGIHDISGSYQRSDVYRFGLNKQMLEPVNIEFSGQSGVLDHFPYVAEEDREKV